MPNISEQNAVTRAEAFIAERRTIHPCGPLQAVSHKPADDKIRRYTGRDSGSYHVEFAYSGPPVRKDSFPRRDHPTVVVVDDETGECSIMKWL